MTNESAHENEGVYGMAALSAMLGIATVIFLVAIDQTIVSTALPRIVGELSGFNKYPWIATSYLLTSAIMVPIIGKLGDIYGRKNFLLASIVIFVGASALAGLAPSMNFLILSRGLQGIGAGMLQATAFASVSDLFPQPERRARWQGILTASFAFASVVGPVLGGYMTEHLGWRSIFYINLPIGVLALALISWNLPINLTAKNNGSKKIDWFGAFLISLTISTFLLAVEWGSTQYSWASWQMIGLIGASILGMAVFFIVEKRVESPLFEFGLLKIRPFALSSSISLLNGIALFTLIFYTPLLIQGSFGLSASTAGTLLTPLVLGMAAGSFSSAQIFAVTKKLRLLMVSGVLLFLGGMVFLSQTTAATPHFLFGFCLAFCGFGIGMTFPMTTITAQSTIPRQFLGVGTALIQFMRLIGSLLGTAVVGALVTNQYQSLVEKNAAPGIDAKLVSSFTDLQILVNDETLNRVREYALQFGSIGSEQVNSLLEVSRQALSTGVHLGYYLAIFVGLISLALALMLRDSDIKREELTEEAAIHLSF